MFRFRRVNDDTSHLRWTFAERTPPAAVEAGRASDSFFIKPYGIVCGSFGVISITRGLIGGTLNCR